MPETGSFELRAEGAVLKGEYRLNARTSSLRDAATGKPICEIAREFVSLGPLPWPHGPDAGKARLPCIQVVDSEVIAEIQQNWNAGAIFVVPARFNGTATPNARTVFRSVDEYASRPAGGSRAQLAVHPALGQFILQNAATASNKAGAQLADSFQEAASRAGFRLQVTNGFLELPDAPSGEAPATALLQQAHSLKLLVVKGVPACGLCPDLRQLSKSEHQVNMMYVAAVHVGEGGDPTFKKNAAVGILAAQYYGAMRTAAMFGRHCKVFLMPAGTGMCGNTLEMVASAMSLAVEMLNVDQRGLLDIHALTWAGDSQEHTKLVSLLASHGKLLVDESAGRGYGPDGMRLPHVTGVGRYAPDGTFLDDGGGVGGGEDAGPGVRGPARGVEIEDVAWFRGDNSRLEMERRAAISVSAICAGVDFMWRTGSCPMRRWTNDREACNVPGLPEDVVDFPLDDSSLLVPRRAPGPDGVLRPFVGDQVRVLLENSPGHHDTARSGTVGLFGKVVADDGRTKGLPSFEVEFLGGRTHFYEEEWIVQDRGRATKGDKVRIYLDNSESNFDPARRGTRGLIGTVVMDWGPGPGAYDIHFNDGPTLKYDDGWVAPLSEIPQKGDRVKVMLDNPIGNYDPIRTGTTGQVGIVLQNDCAPLPILVHFHDGAQMYYEECWLERVPPLRLRLKLHLPLGFDNSRGLREIDGDYMIDEQQECGGMPVWVQTFDAVSRQEGGSTGSLIHVIHTDSKGRWAVTRMPENAQLLVSRPHGGYCPQSAEQWGLIRIGSFIPIDLHVQALSLVPLPSWPGRRVIIKKKQGCAQCGGAGCDGCFGGAEGCGHEAFCVPTDGHGRPESEAVQEMTSRSVWKPDPIEDKSANARVVTYTRRWVRMIDYGPTSGPGCSSAVGLFNDLSQKTHCGRIFQSSLENAYMVEALNAITLRPRLVHRLFYSWNVDFSIFAVRLFMNGTWLCVEVDDFVPARDQPWEEEHDDKPFCCYSEHFPAVLWPSLVEKAYGKACTLRDHGVWKAPNNSGGWEALGGGGRVDEALADLTGGVASSFSTKDVASDRLFIYLYELQRDCLFVCRVYHARCIRNGVGLNPFAHYAVNRAAHHDGECYVQVFCSSPDGTFSGGLDDNIIIPHHLLRIYPEKAEDGFFWLNIADFHYYFETIFECRLVNSPDVGLPGMPPSRLPGARPPAMGVVPRDKDVKLPPSLSRFGQQETAHSWPPHAEAAEPHVPRSSPEMRGVGLGGIDPCYKGLPLLEEPWDEKPLFYEHVFANAGMVTEHRPPEFTVVMPNLPCEIVACVEQTSTRITQVGPTRPRHTAVLLKVYEELEHNIYSADLVCKSNWMNVRNSMVAFKSNRGGTFRIMAEMQEGARCERLIFRCYSSVPGVTVTAAAGMQRHLLAEPQGPAAASKWSLVGCVRPERLPRGDLPLPVEEDLDTLRRLEHERQCSVM
mmetsp:Transcript_158587/g.508774  ORF Transcript_158587/g.508774 Transcript_158587/m.508774 type:complete len:1445 (+) Transcript_158587:179-4513(+)